MQRWENPADSVVPVTKLHWTFTKYYNENTTAIPNPPPSTPLTAETTARHPESLPPLARCPARRPRPCARSRPCGTRRSALHQIRPPSARTSPTDGHRIGSARELQRPPGRRALRGCA
ncbi:hypothetical protein PAHAL_5G128500 [Panicum hallii]|uniref:Uncharacterized protein n=1 Tax=Panicum hallii TaxID=206008 RepID=A0A2T8IJT8_9POAL|nr:hypothetical protein PAHAL_5G128500 [Panicum hallii]